MSNNSYMVAVNAGNSVPYAVQSQVVYGGAANNPFEGKMIAGMQIQDNTNIRIGDVPDFTWIPDTLGGHHILPYVPYEPNPAYNPPWPQMTIHTSGYLAVCGQWTVDLTPDDITMSCDMPGVKVDALKIEINNGQLTATGVRHDLKNGGNERIAYPIKHQYEVSKYIPESATATLLDGVLTINMKKREEHKPHVVKIRVSK